MKITVVAPKTISRHDQEDTPFRYDFAFWNFYLPLLSLKHTVHFFDTSYYGNTALKQHIETQKPDLLFCMMTGDATVCPDEPWQTIMAETLSGRTKTFNWFCDDVWRFDSFSSNVCNNFHVCSTPEKRYMDKYRDFGYENILYGNWHCNEDLYSGVIAKKRIPFSFAGHLGADRLEFMTKMHRAGLGVNGPSSNPRHASFEEMFNMYAVSLVGLNFTKCSQKPERQMKARIFEVPACGTALLTEHVEGIEELFEIDKEIMVFDTVEELIEKARFLVSNPESAIKIGQAGQKRFLKEHTSKIRLRKILNEIKKL